MMDYEVRHWRRVPGRRIPLTGVKRLEHVTGWVNVERVLKEIVMAGVLDGDRITIDFVGDPFDGLPE